MRTADCLNHIEPYLFAQIDAKREALEAQGVEVLSLGIGDPDMPTPPHIVAAMHKAIDNPKNHQYPDYAGSLAYRQACADWMRSRFGVSVDPKSEVLALIGSKEGIGHLHVAFVNPGEYVLAPSIGYPVYSGGAILDNAKVWYMPMREQTGWLAEFADADGDGYVGPDAPASEADYGALVPDEILAKAKIMFLGYPNNPTGAVATPEFFDAAIAFCKKHDLLLVHDNAYSEICYDGYLAPSILERPGAKEVCIEVFSMSKAYNMTGWRIAFACGAPEAIKALGTVKNNLDSGQFTAIQEAAIAAMSGPQDCIREQCAIYQRRRDLIVDALQAIGLDCHAPKATIYVWTRIPEGYSSAEFAEHVLTDAHVIVTPGSGYGRDGEGYIRISLTCPDDQILESVKRIKESL
ncbi:MAG: aminotransferase class I/II-fold pyridoxal phosphate-dependent enzyme [Coriobacteriales bacterium]|jgi:LL-diaminopimelate aminotransferase|nr:aminotransferase class I/II-fold pyridoxal phosphate-dependent enzyme [Coriobacteriales bacterium]